MAMMVSVVIPCHGGAEDTAACLRSLVDQDPSPLYDALQLLVVDNASPDNTAALATSVPGVQVLRQPTNHGFAGGVNVGLRAARGDVLIVLNNDTLAAPNLIHRLVIAVLRNDEIGLAAPVSNHVKGFARIDVGDIGLTPTGRRELETTLAEFGAGKIQDVDSLSGLCLAMTRYTWHRIGDFDERFGLGNYEDDDYCLRARLLGYRLVIVRDAFLHHRGNRTFDALGLDYRETLAEKRAIFAAKWQNDPAGPAALANTEGEYDLAAREAPAALDRHPRWPDGHLILGRWHHRCGRSAEAIRYLRNYLTRCPTHTDAWIMLAFELMQSAGELAGMRCLDASAKTCHFSLQATLDVQQFYGAWLLRQGRLDEAAARFEEALELQPGSAHFQNLLGKARFDAGRYAEAVACFAAAHAGGKPRAQVGLGVSQWHAGDREAGLRTMAAAAAALPDDLEARQNLEYALQLLRAGDPTTPEASAPTSSGSATP